MISLNEFLSYENIFFDFQAESKMDFFARAAHSLASRYSVFDKSTTLSLLLRREETLSTGIGHRVAIPHITCDLLEDLYLFLFRLKHPIDFDSLDNQPVELVFMVTAPRSLYPTRHIQLLAKLGLFIKKSDVVTDLLQSSSSRELYTRLIDHDKR